MEILYVCTGIAVIAFAINVWFLQRVLYINDELIALLKNKSSNNKSQR